MNETALKKEIEKNPTLTIEELSSQFSTSWSTTQKCLKKMRKILKGFWVPHALTDRNKSSKRYL